jgi:4'-phosphopantetheinyl transferase EntD
VREFAAGRSCARLALAQLGANTQPLLSRSNRSPAWPAGIAGSITHTEGFCGAVAAHQNLLRGLGVDAERVGGVREELWPLVCTPREVDWLKQLPLIQNVTWACLFFSAKEAFYKCQHPITGEWLDFQDLTIEPDDLNATTGLLRIVPTRPIVLKPLDHVVTRFCFSDDLVLVGSAVLTKS